jgi:hypothetical protein
VLRLDHCIKERPDTGSYLGNCRIKPVFLLECALKFRRPLLWIDVDGSILRAPDAIDYGVDFMARPMPPGQGRQWHVGTLFFNATAQGMGLLAQWAAALDTETSDEAALDRVWQAGTWSGTSTSLPDTYFHPARKRARRDTVIMHRLSKSRAKQLHQSGAV